jgi:hypothetical protein
VKCSIRYRGSQPNLADAAKEAKLTQQAMVRGTPPYSTRAFTGQALDARSALYSLAVSPTSGSPASCRIEADHAVAGSPHT